VEKVIKSQRKISFLYLRKLSLLYQGLEKEEAMGFPLSIESNFLEPPVHAGH
jgi:hypothetical protein